MIERDFDLVELHLNVKCRIVIIKKRTRIFPVSEWTGSAAEVNSLAGSTNFFPGFQDLKVNLVTGWCQMVIP